MDWKKARTGYLFGLVTMYLIFAFVDWDLAWVMKVSEMTGGGRILVLEWPILAGYGILWGIMAV